MPFSLLILTHNEEVSLPGCLMSVAWADDIVVFDSYSTDRTVAIARAAGARVLQRHFDDYASQRNAALSATFKYPWVYMIDADERIPEDLHRELEERTTHAPPDVNVFMLRRKDMLWGRWIRRSSFYPTWSPRLVRVGAVSFVRAVNEELHWNGRPGRLDGHFIHLPFEKGLAFWVERHNRYSAMEARVIIQEEKTPLRWATLFSVDPVVRRRGCKQIVYRLSGRPLVVFLYLYVFRMGFLDGAPGLLYARLRSLYEYMIDVKVKELKRKQAGESF